MPRVTSEAGQLAISARTFELLARKGLKKYHRCLADRDVTADLRGALSSVKEKHYAAIIESKEVAKLLRSIDAYGATSARWRRSSCPPCYLCGRANCAPQNGASRATK